MRKIPCQLPNLEALQETNDHHYFKGKVAAAMVVFFGAMTLPFALYLLGYSLYWALFVLGPFFLYMVIPTKWYAANTRRFFIGSFIGALLSCFVLYCIGIMFIIYIGFDMATQWIWLLAILFYAITMCFSIYRQRDLLPLYRKLLDDAILLDDTNQRRFYIESWVKKCSKADLRIGTGLLAHIGGGIAVVCIAFALFTGGPQVSAKILLNNGQESMVSAVIGSGLVGLGLIFSVMVETQFFNLLALLTLKDDEK